MPDWLTQGLSTEILGAIVICIAAALYEWMKGKWPGWLERLQSWFTIVVLLLLSWAALRYLTTQPERITENNIEAKVIRWLDNFNLNVKNAPLEAAYFRRVVTLNNGNKIIIARHKAQEHYLHVAAGLVSPFDKAQLAKLPKVKFDRLIDQIKTEVARSKTNFQLDSSDPEALIKIARRIPITDSLTEDVLLEAVDNMDAVMLLIETAVSAALREASN